MLVDGFTLYNELNMLEYRLTVLNDIVDYFVIVEGKKTFVGNHKLMYYSMHKDRFAKWAHKIIHIVVDFDNKDPWHNEFTQRRAIDKGFQMLNMKPDDILMVGDVDEIPDPNAIRRYMNEMNPKKDVLLEQDGYYYSIENKSTNGYGTKILPYKLYAEKYRYDCEFVRMWKAINFQEPQLIMPRAGWHLTCFGDAKFLHNKINNFSHQETNTKEINTIDQLEKNIKEHKHPISKNQLEYIKVNTNTNLPPRMDLLLTLFPVEK